MEYRPSSISSFAEMRVPVFPAIVNVEVFRGACPCHCGHCPVGRRSFEERESFFGRRDMSMELFRKICEEVAGYPESSLRIHSVGEPLLWPKLVSALELASRANIKTWLFTSGITSDSALLSSLAEKCSIIEVSVNSCSADDYALTKGIDGFQEVRRNIELLSGIIAGKNLGTRLIVSRVESGDEVADQEFLKYWKQTNLVKDAFIRSYHSYNRILSSSDSPQSFKKLPCRVHWTRFNINCDGQAVVCFNELFRHELNPAVVLGDIKKQTILEIWHGQRMEEVRQSDFEGSFKDGDLPCATCSHCQPLNGSAETSEVQLAKVL